MGTSHTYISLYILTTPLLYSMAILPGYYIFLSCFAFFNVVDFCEIYEFLCLYFFFYYRFETEHINIAQSVRWEPTFSNLNHFLNVLIKTYYVGTYVM